MWIFTVNGFFTFVTDRKNPEYLWLRARMREHLEDNFPGVTAEMHPGADYLWRAKVKRTDVAERIAQLVMDSRVDSHFKDVMIRTAAKPKTGQLSKVMYAVWSGAAEWQEYAPYSRTPRSATPTYWKGSSADRKPGTGQTTLPAFSGSENSRRYASDFDWDARDWGGTSAKDPVRSAPAFDATDAELDDWWAALSDEERDEFLDSEEDAQRRREEQEADFHSAARAFGVVAADVFPAPRNRPGNRRSRRKNKRKNRHNQTPSDIERYEQERRDGKHGKEQQNRQAFIDKRRKQEGRA